MALVPSAVVADNVLFADGVSESSGDLTLSVVFTAFGTEAAFADVDDCRCILSACLRNALSSLSRTYLYTALN